MEGQERGQELYEQMLASIKTARTDKGISQKKIAEDLGLQQATYSLIERGEQVTNAARLFAILEYLEINPFAVEDESTELVAINTDELKGTVQELATTNKRQSETIAQLAETNSILVKENAELKEVLKQKEEAKNDDDTGSTD